MKNDFDDLMTPRCCTLLLAWTVPCGCEITVSYFLASEIVLVHMAGK